VSYLLALLESFQEWGALSFINFHLYYYFFPSSFHDFIFVLHHISVSSPVFLHVIVSLSLPCCFLFEVSSSFRKN